MSVQVDVPPASGRLCIAMSCRYHAELTVQRDDRAPLPYCPDHATDRLTFFRSRHLEISYTPAAEEVLRREGMEVIR